MPSVAMGAVAEVVTGLDKLEEVAAGAISAVAGIKRMPVIARLVTQIVPKATGPPIPMEIAPTATKGM